MNYKAIQSVNPETSSFSHSAVTDKNKEAHHALITGNYTKVDSYLFPLFEEAFKSILFPLVFYQLIVAICAIQILSTGLWPSIQSYILFDDNIGKFLYYWFCGVFFCDINNSEKYNIIQIGVYSFLVVFIIFFHILMFFYYNVQRRYFRWMLIISRLCCEFLSTIVLIPLGRLAGFSFYNIVNDSSNAVNIAIFIFATIYYVFFIWLYFVTAYFLCLTPYLSPSPTASWSGRLTFGLMFLSSFSQYLPYFLTIFSKYILSVWILIKLACDFLIIYYATFQPFVKMSTNSLLGAIFCTLFYMDINAVISISFNIKLSNLYLVIALVSLNTVFVVILHLIYLKLIKNVSKKLQLSSYPSESDSAEIYKSLKLDSDQTRCELYLRIGLTEMCPMFLNFSLIKFIYVNHPKLIFSCLRFISYFPGEFHLMKIMFNQAIKYPKYGFDERFLLYQIHRVKSLRESVLSFEITEALSLMQTMTKQMKVEIYEFWKNVPNNPSILYDIKKKVDLINAKYVESITKWPNNIKLYEYYHGFLVECAMNFYESLKIKNTYNMIEIGKNLAVDNSFRSLLRAYPNYLKKGIIDPTGNKIYNNKLGGSGNRAGGNSSKGGNSEFKTSGTIDGELDIESEESLAKSSFTYPRLRMAYERALAGRKSINSRRLKISSIWTFLVIIAILTFSYIFCYDIFHDSITSIDRQYHLNLFRFSFDNMLFMFTFDWFTKEGIISQDLLAKMKKPVTSPMQINLNNDISVEETRWIAYSTENYNLFIDGILHMSLGHEDAEGNLDFLLKPSKYFYFCNKGIKNGAKQNASFNLMLNYLLQSAQIVVFRSKTPGFIWERETNLCEIYSNFLDLMNSFDIASMTTNNDQYFTNSDIHKRINTLIWPIALLMFFVTEPLLGTFVFLYFQELRNMLKMMSEADPEAKAEASKPIKVNSHEDTENVASDHSSSRSLSVVYFIGLTLIPIIIGILLYVFSMLYALKENEMVLFIDLWLYVSATKPNFIMKVLVFSTYFLGVKNGLIQTYLPEESFKGIISNATATLSSINTILNIGDKKKLPSLQGVLPKLDELNFKDHCKINSSSTDITTESKYQCFSSTRLVFYMVELIDDMVANVNTENFSLDSNYFHLFNIVNYYLLGNATESSKELSQYARNFINTFRLYGALICFGGSLLMIISLLFFWMELNKLDSAFAGGLMLVKRLPPASVIANTTMMYYLLGNEKFEKKNNKMSTSKSVIHTSTNAVLCLSRNESIEIINQAVTNLFGFMPEQLLGQPISTIFQTDDNTLSQHFAMMRNGESSLLYETSTIAISDDDQQIPVHLNLLGFSEDSTNCAKSFVVVLRDETSLRKRQIEAERAKARSESLLYQMLPRDVVTRLNSGETDISFTVPIATIMFIDIVKFSEYAATLTPAKTMENISLIFAGFEKCLAGHSSMTKIKLIGDVYMACSGLFGDEASSSQDAVQCIQFGLEVLQSLDEVNNRLDSSLMVRIGANTDGPIIAGVLGTDRPIFDIIGDPINVAARLQSMGYPNTIQISQGTYDKIANNNFVIETRGEIELKGKGKRMAYIVRPHTSDSFYIHAEI